MSKNRKMALYVEFLVDEVRVVPHKTLPDVSVCPDALAWVSKEVLPMLGAKFGTVGMAVVCSAEEGAGDLQTLQYKNWTDKKRRLWKAQKRRMTK